MSELGGLTGLCLGVALGEHGAFWGLTHCCWWSLCGVSVPPWGGGSVLSTHSPWATAAARCCLCSCLPLCPSAPNLRLLLCLVCVRGAGGCVRDTGGWLGRAEGVPWAKEQSLRACAVCVWDLQVLSCAGGLSRGVLPESATLWRCCV